MTIRSRWRGNVKKLRRTTTTKINSQHKTSNNNFVPELKVELWLVKSMEVLV